MVFAISEYLKNRSLEVIEVMIDNDLNKKELPEEGVFITRYPDEEPQGTIFLDTLEKRGQEFTVCQKI